MEVVGGTTQVQHVLAEPEVKEGVSRWRARPTRDEAGGVGAPLPPPLPSPARTGAGAKKGLCPGLKERDRGGVGGRGSGALLSQEGCPALPPRRGVRAGPTTDVSPRAEAPSPEPPRIRVSDFGRDRCRPGRPFRPPATVGPRPP